MSEDSIVNDMQKGDFFRVHDGPRSWSFGRCRRSDDEWLVVETFGKGEPRYGWAPINSVVAYSRTLVPHNIARFLSYAEIWP